MDNSLLLLKEQSENLFNKKKDDLLNIIMGITICMGILLLYNYNNIYINLLIFILFYSILYLYLIIKRKVLDEEKNYILTFILGVTFIYDLLNIFEYNKTSIYFISINISLILIKILIIYNF